MNRNERAMVAILGFVVGAVWFASASFAHRATERYIPIGQSPGASGKITVIGYITGVESEHVLTVVPDPDWASGDGGPGEGADPPVTVVCTERTDFWLDRSALELTNLRGDIEDCEVGRLVEVRFFGDDVSGRQAWWVKVRVDEEN